MDTLTTDPAAAPPALADDEIRLRDGRLARLGRADAQRDLRIIKLLLRAGIPRNNFTAPVELALLALLRIETIDGQPVRWPEPRLAAIDRFVASFDPKDLDDLALRYARPTPTPVPAYLHPARRTKA